MMSDIKYWLLLVIVSIVLFLTGVFGIEYAGVEELSSYVKNTLFVASSMMLIIGAAGLCFAFFSVVGVGDW